MIEIRAVGQLLCLSVTLPLLRNKLIHPFLAIYYHHHYYYYCYYYCCYYHFLQEPSDNLNLAIQRPTHGGPFIISKLPLRDIIMSYRSDSVAFRQAAIAFGGIGLAIFSTKLLMFGWSKWRDMQIRYSSRPSMNFAHFYTLSRQPSWFLCDLHGRKAQGNHDFSDSFKLCLHLLFFCMLCFTCVKPSLMKGSCQLQHMLCTKVLDRCLLRSCFQIIFLMLQ